MRSSPGSACDPGFVCLCGMRHNLFVRRETIQRLQAQEIDLRREIARLQKMNAELLERLAAQHFRCATAEAGIARQR